MEKLHQEQAEEVMQGGAMPDDEQIQNLLEKKATGGELTETGKCTFKYLLYRNRAG